MKRIIRSKYPSGDITILLKGAFKKKGIKGEMNQNSKVKSVRLFHFLDFLNSERN